MRLEKPRQRAPDADVGAGSEREYGGEAAVARGRGDRGTGGLAGEGMGSTFRGDGCQPSIWRGGYELSDGSQCIWRSTIHMQFPGAREWMIGGAPRHQWSTVAIPLR